MKDTPRHGQDSVTVMERTAQAATFRNQSSSFTAGGFCFATNCFDVSANRLQAWPASDSIGDETI
jgi:hypothetical protein